ncbi:hypothetical protein [Mesorhizobium sp. IMUNJ 23232]|uniref:hypothetical protein n=1 Tax=Mesorhizobium sp. IMUNJ 23232 TaxID=3376064 RepID=UPI00378E753F
MGAQTASNRPIDFVIDVEPLFAPYMADAAVRLGYVERDFALVVAGSSFRVTTSTPVDRAAIARKINHALYREKIRVESAPLRARFLDLMAQR